MLNVKKLAFNSTTQYSVPRGNSDQMFLQNKKNQNVKIWKTNQYHNLASQFLSTIKIDSRKSSKFISFTWKITIKL